MSTLLLTRRPSFAGTAIAFFASFAIGALWTVALAAFVLFGPVSLLFSLAARGSRRIMACFGERRRPR